jgi:hypothetical protein
VSIVDTKRNQIVGDMLKVWEKGYAPGKSEKEVPIAQREFSVTVPAGLEDRCGVAGDCVSFLLGCAGRLGDGGDRLLICTCRCCSGGGMAPRRSRRMSLVWILGLWRRGRGIGVC